MTDWPHAPVHRLSEAGAYMVTAGTYLKAHYFGRTNRLTMLQDTLLMLANKHGWQLQAWAVFSNHYHFVAFSPENAASLAILMRQLHSITALDANRRDDVQGRKVWHQYHDTRLTFERSYLARLNYVHENPVRHGLTATPEAYEWCSAGWFERMADRSFYNRVRSMKTDEIKIEDEYEPIVVR